MVDELVGWLDRPTPVVWDEINDRHDTGARAMEAFDPAATHHLVVQDDVIPCVDLLASAERAISYTPGDVPVSFYLGRVRPFAQSVTRALKAHPEASWLAMQGIYWGPAVALPTADIPDMLAWFRTVTVENYDRRMSRWYQRRQKWCWYTRPSLVEHRGEESLSHHTKAGRHAYEFLGADTSGLEVDWERDVVQLRKTGAMDLQRQRAAKR